MEKKSSPQKAPTSPKCSLSFLFLDEVGSYLFILQL